MLNIRKTILFAGIVLFLIAGAIAVFTLLSSGSEGEESLLQKILPSQLPQEKVLRADGALSFRPEGETIEIGTADGSVRTKNFYPEKVELDESGGFVFYRDEKYFIAYDTLLSGFWIAIIGGSFDETRKEAEVRLLELLEISQKDACRLDVVLGIQYDSANPLSGRGFPLSFCAVLVR
ncbi:MAG: hypothetical protein AAB495_00900 [Patescibacteria group bacterium]